MQRAGGAQVRRALQSAPPRRGGAGRHARGGGARLRRRRSLRAHARRAAAGGAANRGFVATRLVVVTVPTTSARKWAPVQTGVVGALSRPQLCRRRRAASLRAELVRVQHDLAYQTARCEYLEAQLNSDGVRVFCLRVRCCPTWSRAKRRVVLFGALLTGVLGATLYYFNANPAAVRQITPMLGSAMAQVNSAVAQVQAVVSTHIGY
jgi:hypothetical protein